MWHNQGAAAPATSTPGRHPPPVQGIRRPSLPDSFGVKDNLAYHEVRTGRPGPLRMPCACALLLAAVQAGMGSPRCAGVSGGPAPKLICLWPLRCDVMQPPAPRPIPVRSCLPPSCRWAPPSWPRCCTARPGASSRWSASRWCPAAGRRVAGGWAVACCDGWRRTVLCMRRRACRHACPALVGVAAHSRDDAASGPGTCRRLQQSCPSDCNAMRCPRRAASGAAPSTRVGATRITSS